MLVGGLGEVGVDVKGGRRSRVPETAGSGADVDAVEQHRRGSEMAKVVQTNTRDSELCSEANEGTGDVVRLPRRGACRMMTEDVSVPGRIRRFHLVELAHGDVIKREAPFGVGFRWSKNRAIRGVGDLAGDVQRAALHVDVFPLQRTQLAAPSPGDSSETEEDRQVRVDNRRRGDQLVDLSGSRQMRP